MFQYFPGNYWWSLLTIDAILNGAEISEIDEICRPLLEISARGPYENSAAEEWFLSWSRMGHRLERLAAEDEANEMPISAASKYYRANVYYANAEQLRDARLIARGKDIYLRSLECFAKAVELSGDPVEKVQVPYEDTTLASLFVRATDGTEKAPCLIHFGGADSLKEHLYLRHRDGLARQGISLLIVDHPGVGEAVRLQNMPTIADIERAASAASDYLETRDDVDPDRLGICALSQGGYYAPRVAAFEPRMKLCVVWGAIYDMETILREYNSITEGNLRDGDKPRRHRCWGGLELDEIDEVIEAMTLEGIMDRITCPLLVMHGENDQQAPLWRAQRTFDEAVNSSRRDYKVFTMEEGGSEHCQVDVGSMAVTYIHDWVGQRFREMAPASSPA